MKEIVEFLKQRRNLKYSLGIVIFGLIFALSFQANKAQILEKPIKIKINLKTKEGREHLMSGWKEERGLVWLVGRTITQEIPKILPEKKPFLEPERIEEYYKLGKKYYREGQYSKARREFQKVSVLNPEYKEVKRYLEKVRLKVGIKKEDYKFQKKKSPEVKGKVWFEKEASVKVSLAREKTYRMVIKAFSCSPPDTRDQRIEVHFNDVALDRLKFRKTSEWQKFSVNIPPYLLQETNTIKFVYTQDTHLSPIAFDSLEFKNYICRIKGLYLLLDSPGQGRNSYLTSRSAGYAFGFALLLWLFWLCHSRFLFRLIPACRRGRGGPADASSASTGEVEEAGLRMQFPRAVRIDFLSYLPSIVLLSLLALISFFSPYQFVYSLKVFFVLALTPTAVLKLLPYKNLFPRSIIKIKFIKIVFRFILHDIKKTCSEIKSAYSVCLSFFSFLKRQIITFRRFLVRYHKTNLSSAFILDFMLLLVLCAFLFMVQGFITAWIAGQVANLAYFLLVIGVAMKAIQFFKESKKR